MGTAKKPVKKVRLKPEVAAELRALRRVVRKIMLIYPDDLDRFGAVVAEAKQKNPDTAAADVFTAMLDAYQNAD
jgi:hypothetical protein